MSETFDIFFSNQLEILYQNLKIALFRKDVQPFKRRLIVVYGPAMKNWLTIKMATDPDLRVAAGYEILHLNDAFEKLLSIFQVHSNQYIPSRTELSLAIEQAIFRKLTSIPFLDEVEKEKWTPIFDYLKIDEGSNKSFSLTRKTERRLIGLSDQLANCFKEYGRTASKLLIEWEKQPSRIWQEELWKELFDNNGPWTYFIKAFEQPLKHIPNIEAHFFSISYLTKHEFQFIERLSGLIPIKSYLLSPCAVFWSDIKSDKEKMYFEKRWQKRLGNESSQVLELEEFLRDRNVLLANFGRLGREMACQVEESSAQTHANYKLPKHIDLINQDELCMDDIEFEENSNPQTLLQGVQSDILLMRTHHDGNKINLDSQDSTIQLHVASSKRREIEIIYNNILELMDKNPSICPCDIIVMTPQISEYSPYIQSVFGCKKSKLNFQILDLQLSLQSEIVQGFLQLLNLSDGRWNIVEMLQLFEHSSFQRRLKLTQIDYVQIQKWIEETRILWGDTNQHRNEILQRSHCKQGMVEETQIGTWDYGITRLLLGLTTILPQNPKELMDIVPSKYIEFSQSELLGKWIRILHSLRDDLSPLHDRTLMTMEEWCDYLNCLLESYLQPNFEDSQSIEEYESLKGQLENLKNAARSIEEAKFSFISVKKHLLSQLEQNNYTYRENHLQSIRFCSMLPLRTIPSKVIALIGMQEEAFPRINTISPFNLASKDGKSDYSPTSTDFDRYLFLELLHSAQEHLLISYQGYNNLDAKEIKPSIVVEELFSYLDNHYSIQHESISKSCIFTHPFDSFDQIYFKTNSLLKNYSTEDFKAAQAIYGTDSLPPHSFVGDFQISSPQIKTAISNCSIDIKYLTAVARNPIKFHLNKILEIYLQNSEDRQFKSEEDLVLDALDKSNIKKSALKESFERIIFQAEKEGKLPLGMFKEIATNKIKSEYDVLQTQLKKHGIRTEDLFDIEFSESCSDPYQISEKRWIYPAIPISYSEGYNINIVGELKNVTPKGLLSVSSASLSDVWKMWPQFLAFSQAAKNPSKPLERQLILANTSKVKKAFFADSEPYLKQFIDYYMVCHHNFSPLIPEWIPLILKENHKGLEEKMRQLFSNTNFGSDYKNLDLSWILNSSSLPSAEKLVQDWSEQTKLLLTDINSNWYPSKDEND
ncbi:MAG: exodeoxyribonuclease V subunit gamma [Parachlamydiaceae bacterium]|nr:exodeoxyribonuclease V subunit gamma [Parachlamydiaceae bacterium]